MTYISKGDNVYELFEEIKNAFATCCGDLSQTMDEKVEKAKFDAAKMKDRREKFEAGDPAVVAEEMQKVYKKLGITL